MLKLACGSNVLEYMNIMGYKREFGPGIEKSYKLRDTYKMVEEAVAQVRKIERIALLPEPNQEFLAQVAKYMCFVMRDAASTGWRHHDQFWGLYLVGSRSDDGQTAGGISDVDLLSVGNQRRGILEMKAGWSLGVCLDDPFERIGGNYSYFDDIAVTDDEKLAKYARSFFGQSDYPGFSLRRSVQLGARTLSIDLISRNYDPTKPLSADVFEEIDDQLGLPRIPLIEIGVAERTS